MFTHNGGNVPRFSMHEQTPPIDDITISEDGILSLLLKLDAG